MAPRILVVEDEPALQETLVYNLKKQGYQAEAVGDGWKALESVRAAVPDLILLDVMLPGIDGFEICRILRKDYTVPILMLTARDQENDRLNGLESGADDYLAKPFSMRELLARVKAQLRRMEVVRLEKEREPVRESEMPHKLFQFGDLTIDITRREVCRGEEVLTLRPQEYELLVFLAEHKGKVLSRDFILERVWGWDYIGNSRTVDVHVRWLREKIESDPSHPERIVTVRGGGYRFEG